MQGLNSNTCWNYTSEKQGRQVYGQWNIQHTVQSPIEKCIFPPTSLIYVLWVWVSSWLHINAAKQVNLFMTCITQSHTINSVTFIGVENVFFCHLPLHVSLWMKGRNCLVQLSWSEDRMWRTAKLDMSHPQVSVFRIVSVEEKWLENMNKLFHLSQLFFFF